MYSNKSSNKLSMVIQNLKNAPVLPNSYLILGAGKFGKTALQHALDQPNFSHILIIDKNPALLPNEFLKISDIATIQGKAISKLPKKMYFPNDIACATDIFQIFFAEKIVPAVPIHAVAYLIAKLLSYSEIRFNNTIPESLWDQLLKTVPKEVLLQENSTNGVILFSWAKNHEICPPNCTGPLEYCPHHNRNKPLTITDICRNIHVQGIRKYVIESHQVKAGLGIIQGKELKAVLLDCLEFVRNNNMSKEESLFFIATTCNCHGVLNVFV